MICVPAGPFPDLRGQRYPGPHGLRLLHQGLDTSGQARQARRCGVRGVGSFEEWRWRIKGKRKYERHEGGEGSHTCDDSFSAPSHSSRPYSMAHSRWRAPPVSSDCSTIVLIPSPSPLTSTVDASCRRSFVLSRPHGRRRISHRVDGHMSSRQRETHCTRASLGTPGVSKNADPLTPWVRRASSRCGPWTRTSRSSS